MRQLISSLVVVSIISAGSLFSGPLQGTKTFSGMVRDERGRSLPGVLVQLINTDRSISVSVMTSHEGRYYVDSLFPGTYDLRARGKGFEPSEKRGVLLDSRASVDLILSRLKPGVVQTTSEDLYDQFPVAPGHELLADTCLRCHGRASLLEKRKTRESWQRTIELMAGYRHEDDVPAGVVDRLVNYFAKHFSADRPATPEFGGDQPEPPPSELANVRITEYVIPDQGLPEKPVSSSNTAPIFPHNIIASPEGMIWFAMFQANKIGRLDPRTGAFRSYPVPTPGSVPHGITVAQDGPIWFTEARGSKVGMLDPKTGTIIEIPTNSGGNTIAPDSQGNMYLTMNRTNQIGRVNTKTRKSTAYDLLTPHAVPYGVIVDQKDQVWWTQLFGDSIGKLDPKTGLITEYPTPTKPSGPRRLAVDQGGNIWFTEWVAGKIGKLDPTTGEITEYDLPSPAFEPYELCVDNEDAVWVSGFLSNTLARFDRATGTFVEYPIPTPRSEIRKMTPDPKGGIWFAQSHTDTIGHIMVKR